MATVLNARIHQLGWGYRRFAREYAKAGDRLGYGQAPVSESTFHRWCTGAAGSLPRPRAQQILSVMFDCPAAALFQQAPPATAITAPNREDGEMLPRREMLRIALAGAGLSIAPAESLLEGSRRGIDAALEASRISTTTLARWDRAADEYAAAYQITPPQLILPDVVADLEELRHLLDGPQPTRIRASLCRSSARLAVMAAICLSALGAHRQARAWLHTARLAADETGDPTLTGLVLARTSIVTLYYGSPGQALADASTAVSLLGNTGGPATARAHLVAARALARLGHHPSAVLAQLDNATTLHDALSSAERADTAFGYTDRQFTWHLANALTAMGRRDEALPLQQQALNAYQPTERLDPTLIRLDMAHGVLLAGDVDEAVHQAANVWEQLPADHRTGMIVTYIGGLLRSVPETASDLPAVQELKALASSQA